MFNERNFSLAFLTIPDVSPLEAVKIAHETGYSHIGLRLLPALENESIYPLISDKKMRTEVLTALKDTGTQVADVEMVRLGATTDLNQFNDFFECVHLLGAQNVSVVSDDPSLERFTSNFSTLCQYADPFGIRLNLEPMQWKALHSYYDAVAVLQYVSQPNAGLLIDTFHFDRMKTSFDIFDHIKPSWLQVFQICDAPVSSYTDVDLICNEARTARLLPGDGDLNFAPYFQNIPETTIVSIEVPNQHTLTNYSPLQRAQMALHATKKLYK
jgi:sugar phosphate isomerase/epimerase